MKLYCMKPPGSFLAVPPTVRRSIFSVGMPTPTGTAWRIPAAWRLKVKDGLVTEWQVYADNKPVYELLSTGA